MVWSLPIFPNSSHPHSPSSKHTVLLFLGFSNSGPTFFFPQPQTLLLFCHMTSYFSSFRSQLKCHILIKDFPKHPNWTRLPGLFSLYHFLCFVFFIVHSTLKLSCYMPNYLVSTFLQPPSGIEDLGCLVSTAFPAPKNIHGLPQINIWINYECMTQ